MKMLSFSLMMSLTLTLLTVGIATTTMIAFADNDKQDKCVSQRIGESSASSCSTNDESQEVLDDFKESCKDGTFGDEIKCSSSQTGHGGLGNYCKKGELSEEVGGGTC